MKKAQEIINEVKKAVIGKDEEIKKVMMVILAKGHILLEDIPGVGKTTLAMAFSKAMSLQSRRIQFTVDVLPSDVVGFTMIDQKTGEVKLHQGAVFCNIFLADEINRTSSKTQAALLEVMEEGRITIDGYTQKALTPFIVIATQNPYGSAGTQLLPESQLDRFMIQMSIGYPEVKDEVDILKRKHIRNSTFDVMAVTNLQGVLEMQKECEEVFIEHSLYLYIVNLVNATRTHDKIRQGASPRASIALMNMAKACAYIHDRDYVIPSDVQAVFKDVVGHRIVLHSDTQLNIRFKQALLQEVLDSVTLPDMRKRNV